MNIQGYEVYSIICDRFWLDGGAMFGTVPKVLWERKHPADEKNRIELVNRSLVFKGHNRVILVDTGIGEVWDEKFKSIYNVSQSSLVQNLEKIGIKPEDVTDIIVTHLHFDHIGGAFMAVNGTAQFTFPNAKYHVQKANYEEAINPNPREKASYLKTHIQQIVKAEKFVMHDGETELFEGLQLHVSNGHTKGQQWVTLSDDNQTICFAADVIPTASHIRLPWVMGYDLYPIELMEEKTALLNQALKENWIVCFEHGPFTEAATVKMSEKGVVVDQQVSINES